MADGKITFSTKLDNSELHKQLKDTEKEIEKATAAKAKATEAKLPLEKQLESLKPKLEEAKKDLAEYRLRVADAQKLISNKDADPEDVAAAKRALPEDLRNVENQKKETAKLEKQWEGASRKVEQYNAQIADADNKIASAEDKAGGIMQQLEKRNGTVAQAMEKAGVSMKGIEKTLVSLARRVFVFQLITKALRSAREYFGKLLATNQEYNVQVQRLRAALATAFQPLYEAALPVLMKILNLLTQIATVAAQAISALFGKTAAQSAKSAKALNAQAKAIGGVGSAAEEAAGQLASFDEINKLEDQSSGGGGGGAGMDFSEIEGAGELSERMQDILNYVRWIGAGLALWKLSDKLPGGLAKISKVLAGIAFTIGGILMFADGFKDAAENGMDLYNMLEMVGGLIVGGMGIGILAGTWIPMLIAGFAAAILALAYFTGHGDELIQGLKQTVDGLIKFFTAENWDEALEGLSQAWDGFASACIAVLDSLDDGFAKLMDWLNELTGGEYEPIFEGLKKAWSGLVQFLEDLITGEVFTREYWQNVFGVIGEALGWDEFKPKLDALWEAVSAWWTKNVAPKFTLKYWADQFSAIGDGIKEAFRNGINSAIGLVNKFTSWLNSSLTFTIPAFDFGFLGSFGGASMQLVNIPPIPPLAQGAVIPPNAPFLAALGDQRNGYNLEGPEDMFRGIVREEVNAARGSGMDSGRLDEMIDLLGVLIEAVNGIGDDRIGRAASRYISRTSRARG